MTQELSGRSNIVSLAYENVLKPIAKAADPVSWILFVLFLAILVVSVVFKFSDGWAGQVYSSGFLAFWYGSWGVLLLSTIGPIFSISKERNEVPLSILVGVGVGHLVLFISISVIVLIEYDRPESVTGLMAAFAAAMMVGIGWVVQHQSAARSSRRAHTFNILMQSRLSKEFQEHCNLRANYYSAGKLIPASDAPLMSHEGYEEVLAGLMASKESELQKSKDEFKQEIVDKYEAEIQLCKKKYESMRGVKYLLNFYEFMCAGICQKELDRHLLYATVASIVSSLYEDTRLIRAYLKDSQPTVFENLDRVIEKHWD